MQLNHVSRGAIVFVVGLLLFMNQLGIIRHSLDTIIIVIAVLLMFYGFSEMNGYALVQKLLHKFKRR